MVFECSCGYSCGTEIALRRHFSLSGPGHVVKAEHGHEGRQHGSPEAPSQHHHDSRRSGHSGSERQSHGSHHHHFPHDVDEARWKARSEQHSHHHRVPQDVDEAHLEFLEARSTEAEIAAMQAHQRELDASPNSKHAALEQERRAVQVAAAATERVRGVTGNLDSGILHGGSQEDSTTGSAQFSPRGTRVRARLAAANFNAGSQEDPANATGDVKLLGGEVWDSKVAEEMVETLEMLQVSQRRTEIEEAKVQALENVAESLREEADAAMAEANGMAAAAAEVDDLRQGQNIVTKNLRVEVEALQEEIRTSRVDEVESLQLELGALRAEEAQALDALLAVKDENEILCRDQVQIEDIVQSLDAENKVINQNLEQAVDAVKEMAQREAEAVLEAQLVDSDLARESASRTEASFRLEIAEIREELNQAWVDVDSARAPRS